MYMLGLYSQHNTNDSYLYVYVGAVQSSVYMYQAGFCLNCSKVKGALQFAII